MEGINYTYIGAECTIWDENGSIFLSTKTSQKDLEYLYNKKVDNIVKTEPEKVKK